MTSCIKLIYAKFLLLFFLVNIGFTIELNLEDIRIAVEYNESLLKNYQANFTLTYASVDPRFLRAIGEDEQRIELIKYRYVWEGQKWRCESTTFTPQGKIIFESLRAVDESRSMTLAFIPKREDNSEGTGIISSNIGATAKDIVPDRFMLVNIAGESLSSLLKERGGKILGLEKLKKREVMVMEIRTRNNTRIKLFLDPEKSFSLVRKEIYTVPDDDLFLVFENINLQKLSNDLWFPISGDATLYMKDENGAQYQAQVARMKVSEESLKINQPLEKDIFRINYPLGSHVWDKTTGVRYQVGARYAADKLLENLHKEGVANENSEQPSLDKTEGRLTSDKPSPPPAVKLDSKVAKYPGSNITTKSRPFQTEETYEPTPTSTLLWPIILAIVVGILIVIFLICRRLYTQAKQ